AMSRRYVVSCAGYDARVVTIASAGTGLSAQLEVAVHIIDCHHAWRCCAAFAPHALTAGKGANKMTSFTEYVVRWRQMSRRYGIVAGLPGSRSGPGGHWNP